MAGQVQLLRSDSGASSWTKCAQLFHMFEENNLALLALPLKRNRTTLLATLEEPRWCRRMRSLTLLALKQQMEAEVVCFFAHVERWGGPVLDEGGGCQAWIRISCKRTDSPQEVKQSRPI